MTNDSSKDFLVNRRQHITRKMHRLWGNSLAGHYLKRDWEDFQETLSEYFSEVDKLLQEHDDRKSNTDQKG